MPQSKSEKRESERKKRVKEYHKDFFFLKSRPCALPIEPCERDFDALSYLNIICGQSNDVIIEIVPKSISRISWQSCAFFNHKKVRREWMRNKRD